MKTNYTPSKKYTIIAKNGSVQGSLTRLQDAVLLADTFKLAMKQGFAVIRNTDNKLAYTNW